MSGTTGITAPGPCSADFTAGTIITLTAAAGNGSVFTGWSGACTNTSGTCTVTLNSATSVAAIFTVPTFSVTVTKVGNGVGTVTSSPVNINCGTICTGSFSSSVTLTAAASPGSTFGGGSGRASGPGRFR